MSPWMSASRKPIFFTAESIAVGGLIEEGVRNTHSGVPFLSRIPILGFAFRAEDRSRTRHEILMLITPYVLETPAEAEEVSRRVVNELSVHPKAATMGKGSLNTYDTNQVPVTKPKDVLP